MRWHLWAVSSLSGARSSPSFLIAISILILGIVGYGAWSYLRPNENVRSERVVRQFARAVGKEVNSFRRRTRQVVRKKHASSEEVAKAMAKIDDDAEKTMDEIQERADQARDELVSLDIEIRTQRNRSRRLDTREDEARAEIAGLATEAKSRLQGED